MTSDQTHVIVGASLTGARAAATLREEGVPLEELASAEREGVA